MKYLEFKGIMFYIFFIGDWKKIYVFGMNENERRKRWIVVCCLSSLNVIRYIRICLVYFEGGLGFLKFNFVLIIFSFLIYL